MMTEYYKLTELIFNFINKIIEFELIENIRLIDIIITIIIIKFIKRIMII